MDFFQNSLSLEKEAIFGRYCINHHQWVVELYKAQFLRRLFEKFAYIWSKKSKVQINKPLIYELLFLNQQAEEAPYFPDLYYMELRSLIHKHVQ